MCAPWDALRPCRWGSWRVSLLACGCRHCLCRCHCASFGCLRSFHAGLLRKGMPRVPMRAGRRLRVPRRRKRRQQPRRSRRGPRGRRRWMRRSRRRRPHPRLTVQRSSGSSSRSRRREQRTRRAMQRLPWQQWQQRRRPEAVPGSRPRQQSRRGQPQGGAAGEAPRREPCPIPCRQGLGHAGHAF